jgi:hypothetical protein
VCEILPAAYALTGCDTRNLFRSIWHRFDFPIGSYSLDISFRLRSTELSMSEHSIREKSLNWLGVFYRAFNIDFFPIPKNEEVVLILKRLNVESEWYVRLQLFGKHTRRGGYPHNFACTVFWQLFQENNVQGRIVVKSPDTGILVLLVHYFRPSNWSDSPSWRELFWLICLTM